MGREQGCGACGSVGVAAGSMHIVMLGSVLASACSLVFPADGVQCTTTSDCTARGGAFIGSVCINSVCSPPDAGSVVDARHDVTVEAARDARGDARSDARSDARGDGPGDARRAEDGAADAAASNDWTCLGNVHWPDASTGSEILTVPYVNAITSSAIPGIWVEPCQKLDPTCAHPLSEAGITDDAGIVTFSVPSGYDGYLLSLWDASLPALMYVNPPILQNTTVPWLPMIPTNDLSALAAAIGPVDGAALTLNPERGLVMLIAYDCATVPAAGVSFSLSPPAPSSTLVYSVGGFPSLTATSTDSSGGAVIVNVPPGAVTITATLAPGHPIIETANGFSEAGDFTLLNLVPTPP